MTVAIPHFAFPFQRDPVTTPPPNLIPNPSFEYDALGAAPVGWLAAALTGGGTLTYDAVVNAWAGQGTHALRVTASNIAAVPPPPPNLITNTSFEADANGVAPAGWTTAASFFLAVGATATVISTDHQAGTKCARLVTTAAVAAEGMQTVPTPPSGNWAAGVTYTFTVWLKGTAGGEQVTLGAGLSGDFKAQNVTLSTAWAQYTCQWTPTATRTAIAVAIYTQASTAVTILVDNAVMVAPQATGGNIYFSTVLLPALAGQSYSWAFLANIMNAATEVYGDLYFYNASSAVTGHLPSAIATTQGVRTIRQNAVLAPPNTTQMALFVAVQNQSSVAAQVDAIIDGVVLVAGSTAANYADGDTAGWSWTGTAGNSTSTGPSSGGKVQVVEQDDDTHVMTCETVIASCPLGARQERPEFGWDWPEFRTWPLDLSSLVAALQTYEPRGPVASITELAQGILSHDRVVTVELNIETDQTA